MVNPNLNLPHQSIMSMVLSWIVIGWITAILGMLGFIHPLLSLLLLFPIFFTFRALQIVVSDIFEHFSQQKWFLRITLGLFGVTLVSHFIGVMLPETGFDALWYHLPIIQEYILQNEIVYDPRWYQSLYPLLGDLLHLLGFQIFGVFGAKLISYLTMIALLLVVYLWLRVYLDQGWSLVSTLVVSLFQVVGWQASSAYVDVMFALWFVAGSYLLIERKDDYSFITGLFFLTAIPATKYIGLGFVPLITVLALSGALHRTKVHHFFKKYLSIFWITGVFLPLTVFISFWYLRAGVYTGNILYPKGTEFAVPVIAQMERGGWGDWLWYRLLTIYDLPNQFFLQNDGYTTHLFWLLPLCYLTIYLTRKIVKINRENRQSDAIISAKTISSFLSGALRQRVHYLYTTLHSWWVFAFVFVYGLLFWWFFPPPSTRYVLGPVIVGWIGLVTGLLVNRQTGKQENRRTGEPFDMAQGRQEKPSTRLRAGGRWGQLFDLQVGRWQEGLVVLIKMVFIVTILGHLAIRLYVNTRGLPYLLGLESQQEYLNRFRNGFTDEKIDSFYGR